MTGNGDFDGVTDFGESFVKLSYTTPRQGASASLKLVDWWTPWSDAERTRGAPAMTSRQALPTNFRAHAAGMASDWGDQDLGSGGPLFVRSADALLGAGKDGILYVLDAQRMGKTAPADLENPAGNYAKLKSPPIFFTYFRLQPNPAPANIQSLNSCSPTALTTSTAARFTGRARTSAPYCTAGASNGNLRAWSIAADGTVRYLATGTEVASARRRCRLGGCRVACSP